MDMKLKLRSDGMIQEIAGGDFTISEIGDGFIVLGNIISYIAKYPDVEGVEIDIELYRPLGINIKANKLVDFLMGHGVDYEGDDGSASGMRLITEAHWTDDHITVSGWQRDGLSRFLRGEETLVETMRTGLHDMLEAIDKEDA